MRRRFHPVLIYIAPHLLFAFVLGPLLFVVAYVLALGLEALMAGGH